METLDLDGYSFQPETPCLKKCLKCLKLIETNPYTLIEFDSIEVILMHFRNFSKSSGGVYPSGVLALLAGSREDFIKGLRPPAIAWHWRAGLNSEKLYSHCHSFKAYVDKTLTGKLRIRNFGVSLLCCPSILISYL